MKFNKRFKKNPKYVHQRSEGLTRRGQARQERLMLGLVTGTGLAMKVLKHIRQQSEDRE